MAKRYTGAGFTFLGLWLLLQGATQLFGLYFDGIDIAMGVIALLAGALILVNK